MSSFLPHSIPSPKKRKLNKVPFVEMFHGRLQGVVSSGSSASRVYVSLIHASTGQYYCSTNNNRPCGGLRGGPCKHLEAMVTNAVAQYGSERVGRFMGMDTDAQSAYQIIGNLGGVKEKDASGQVFARFLDYLRYVELPSTNQPRPQMAWFVTGR